MKIELEFLDTKGVALHSSELVYDGMVPIPSTEETALVEGRRYTVKKRSFMYLGSGVGVDIKVSFLCEELPDPAAPALF